jgi:UDP-GlcNAc:undecaprenyl-phosphate GlcNAc-1-phosphate transferase
VPEAARLLGAVALAFAITFALTPVLRRVALRTEFLDRPLGYKRHAAATPYLGGAALVAGFATAAVAFGDALGEYKALLACVLLLCIVGTLDDRLGLGIGVRLGTQVAVGVAIWAAGLGWNFLGSAADLALTIVWVVGLINAFNLMDNLDGATGAVGAVSGAGAGTLALIEGQPELAAIAFALAAASAAFLCFNLARPARIFLGDGGSMPIGLVVAVVVTAVPERSIGLENILALVPLAGLVILDTALVVFSRIRRGAPVLSGARDHLSHRLLVRLGSARTVALALAVTQALLCGLALALSGAAEPVVDLAAAAYVAAGLAVIARLEVTLPEPRAESLKQSA